MWGGKSLWGFAWVELFYREKALRGYREKSAEGSWIRNICFVENALSDKRGVGGIGTNALFRIHYI